MGKPTVGPWLPGLIVDIRFGKPGATVRHSPPGWRVTTDPPGVWQPCSDVSEGRSRADAALRKLGVRVPGDPVQRRVGPWLGD